MASREGIKHQRGVPHLPAYVWLFTAGLLFNVFAGVAFTIGLPLNLDRPLLLLALLLVLLDPKRPHLRPIALHVVMAATVLWTLLSWLSTGTLGETAKAFALTDRIALPFAMFVVGPLVYSSPRRRRFLLKAIVLLGLYLGFTALFELVHLSAFVFPRAIDNPDLGINFGRARGPFLSSEPLGMSTIFTMISGGVLATQTTGGWRLASWLCALVSGIAIVGCLTRSCWLAAILVLAVTVITVPSARKAAPAVAAGVGITVAGLTTLVPAVVTGLSDRLETSRSLYDRLNTNAAGVRIVEAHPLTGIGWGRYLTVGSDWVRQGDTYPLTNVAIEIHNVFLSRAAETGILGGVLWATAILAGPATVVFRKASRSTEQQAWQLLGMTGLLASLVPSLTSPNPYPFPNNLMWLFCGIAGAGFLSRARLLPAEVQNPKEAGT